jgi:hypothetical protein
MPIAFDTLAYSRRLRASGVPEEQAAAHAEALGELATSHLATKGDIRELEHKLTELEYRLTIRIGGMLTVAVGVVTALTKLL